MFWLVIPFLLSSLLPYVGCDLSTHRREKSHLAAVTFDPATTSSSASSASKAASTPPVNPVVNITAVFEEEDLDDFLPIFERALADLVNDSMTFTWAGHVLSSSRDLKRMMTEMCAHFQGDKSQVRLIVVFGRVRTVQTVNLISQALGIPVIGYMLDKGDGYIQVHNPLFISLQPSNKHLARGLVSLLSANFWFRLTIITQTELRHDGFYNTFRELTKNGKWKIEDEIFISKGASNAAMNASFERVSGNTSRIFVLHATASLTRRIFVTAKQVLPRQGRFAWIITENAYTRSENVLHVFPLGTKAFLVNHDVVAEELLRDVLDFTMEAFQGDGNGRSALISRLITSPPSSSFSLSRLSSSLASLHISSYSGKNKAYGCWSARSDVIQPHQDPVYSALLSTSIYGLTGQMAFDEDGFMNISKFRVRNLVSDGRQSVWQDIGCVQGREVRPFRIIWPGDAKNLKAETEGKKRYKVVTNPVQPFVITEAPHADYGQCLSDTPCLNLTHKFKSQEVVWRAIEAFENGEGSESGLFTIQCCRGLTIDLLNKLSSDLEFEFTLYIVQDETYGQKAPNGSWTGMMRDLTDNTAHFAVAAFSITSQREGAIDFTDPYFFSGFSVIYSDRTRETSMLAFLEPFSTKVWFAIFVSAHITAVCMALLEWNSPFGLNPWGRKRNKNYSIASGLTMVFSVLFGHTVRAKSPKAWPSKFLQNIWAFAAIFIIASYTANLAAFIAGKHAGINYSDIQDTRLQDIRIGVLQGSAVHEFLKNSGSKLATVAERFHVRKTDEGVDWVIRGKLDALLGDYPILDYARAHLAPSCELKLISKVFGVDRYGLGLPKESPLKAALSKKISEYHRIGFIDDLIDVHFADAHCIKKRISEEDSQLEVTHHAGLFVMLCVGFGVGVLVLLLEHLIYKFLVPFMRQCPEDSTWRSVHLMFVSQRLQRTITSTELVSPHHSAHEMLGIFKKREFARLFQKSTIRRNRLADIAKTKRINRNFYDIVEKAKWLKDMKDSGLMDDDTLSTPSITEIPLKQLTVDVERGTLAPMLASTGASSATVPASNYTGIAPVKGNYSSESSSPESDDSLLGGSRMVTDKSLPISNHSTHPVLTIQALRASPSMSARRLRKQPRDHRYRHHRSHHMGMVSSPELDTGQTNPLLRDDCSYSHSNKVRSLSANSISPIVFLDSPPNNIKHKASSRSSLPTASVVNELSPACTPKQHIPLTVDNATASRVTFSTSLPNGNLVQRLADVDTEGHDSDVDTDSEDEDDDDDGVCRQSIPNILSNPAFMLKAHSDSTHNLACAGASASNYSNNSLLPKTSNITLARTLLYKTRSIQDQLCSAADSAQAEAPMEPFCLDAVTKEELLVLWKSSEIELNKRLEAALREKARLERKLAMLQMHSPV